MASKLRDRVSIGLIVGTLMFCISCSSGSFEGLRVVERGAPPGRIQLHDESLFLLIADDSEPTLEDARDWVLSNGWTLGEPDPAVHTVAGLQWADLVAHKELDGAVDILLVRRASEVLTDPHRDRAGAVERRLARRGLRPEEALVGEQYRVYVD